MEVFNLFRITKVFILNLSDNNVTSMTIINLDSEAKQAIC